jgi:hypothetical protein
MAVSRQVDLGSIVYTQLWVWAGRGVVVEWKMEVEKLED